MSKFIGCDQHKQYSFFRTMDEKGKLDHGERVNHEKEVVRAYLSKLPKGSEVAVEATGSWYWMIDEMEKHGLKPKLTNPRKAKLMMGEVNKTDKLDAGGLALLLRNGTLPSVWIPPQELRDKRELLRYRVVLRKMRTGIKNRMHATLAKYAIRIDEVSDIFGKKGYALLKKRSEELPAQTKLCFEEQMVLLNEIEAKIEKLEERIIDLIEETPSMKLLKTIPGVGTILSATIALEIGDVNRFTRAGKLASYSGTTPREKSSGGKRRFGNVRVDVNRYLKWAFVEAANCISLNRKIWPDHYLVKLYMRIRDKRGHAKAIVAVARSIAESCFWMLKKKEGYKQPRCVSSTHR